MHRSFIYIPEFLQDFGCLFWLYGLPSKFSLSFSSIVRFESFFFHCKKISNFRFAIFFFKKNPLLDFLPLAKMILFQFFFSNFLFLFKTRTILCMSWLWQSWRQSFAHTIRFFIYECRDHKSELQSCLSLEDSVCMCVSQFGRIKLHGLFTLSQKCMKKKIFVLPS